MKLGLYIHIPFCRQKCFYCDFPSYAGMEQYEDAYIRALGKEVRARGKHYGGCEVDTVFFGGGTPSLLSAEALPAILAAVREVFRVADDAEITTEANPGTVTLDKLIGWRKAGVNRISFGVQAFQDKLLRTIGRIHTADDAEEAVRLARQAGFDNINVDLIYGLPGQTVDDFAYGLARASELGIEHLSVYGLSVEEGTVLARFLDEGRMALPTEDEDAAMYDRIEDYLAQKGYARYEISNYAKDGHVCRHNLKYWQSEDYLGLGAAAHSFLGGKRRTNERGVEEYIRRMTEEGTAVVSLEEESAEELRGDYIFLALRTAAGLDREDFRKRFGEEFLSIYKETIEELMRDGLIEVTASHIRLTKRGMKYGNQVFCRFV